MPAYTKTKLISIQTLNQVIFDLHTKPSQYDAYTEIKSTPIPRTEITSISTHTTKSTSMPTLKPWHFRAVLLCVLYIPLHVLVIQPRQYVWYNYQYQLVFFLTFPYYKYSTTPKILCTYIPCYIFCYMVYTRLRVMLVAGLRYVPFFLYVLLLGVINRSYLVSRNSIPAYYQRTTNCEYCQCMWQYRLVHIRSAIPRPYEYDAVLTYRQLFLCCTRDNLAGPIPAPHTTRFVVRSDELQKIYPIRHWGGEAHSNPYHIPGTLFITNAVVVRSQ